MVHYVSYGTPGGEYGRECRAAVVTQVGSITEVQGDLSGPESYVLGLWVLNPTGQFFNQGVQYHAGAEAPGKPDCPNVPHDNGPFRYCHCGWREAAHKGGTWHWPERT